MYAISNASRVYITFFLVLCSALFSSSTLAAEGGYWSTQERRFITQAEVNARVDNLVKRNVALPANSSVSIATPPQFSKNPAGGLSLQTQNIISTMGKTSTFMMEYETTIWGAKDALKSCVRSPACAGRALGTGALLYEGVRGWMDVYDFFFDETTQTVQQEVIPFPTIRPDGMTCYESNWGDSNYYPTCSVVLEICLSDSRSNNECYVETDPNNPNVFIITSPWSIFNKEVELIDYACPSGSYNTFEGCTDGTTPAKYTAAVPLSVLEDSIDDTYEPETSDAPIVALNDEEPYSFTMTKPPSVDFATTTESVVNGQPVTIVNNTTISYDIAGNSSDSPSLDATILERYKVYDENANLVDEYNEYTYDYGQYQGGTNPDPDPWPDDPDPWPNPDSDAPWFDPDSPFCSWASMVCDWFNWTTEEPDLEEPDLTVLISEFEPEEESFDLGLGSGSCPAPIQLNVTFINKTVEVSYQPFCDFLSMIRPFILAAAYLLSAYMYMGVLRRV